MTICIVCEASNEPDKALCSKCNAEAQKQLVMPENLSARGQEAYQIIFDQLTRVGQYKTGGCPAFYSPNEWKERGEQYGQRSILIVVYDGGDLRPFFNMDAAADVDYMVYEATGKPVEKTYGWYEAMQAALRARGLYFEECTNWYSAVYEI